MRCYIAGPMRSRPQFNYPAFMAAEASLASRGWEVFNPAAMDLEHDGKEAAALLGLSIADQEAHAGTPANVRRYAARDLGVIVGRLRAEDGDAIVMLPGWEESIGARAERAAAEWCGLRVLTLEDALAVEVRAA